MIQDSDIQKTRIRFDKVTDETTLALFTYLNKIEERLTSLRKMMTFFTILVVLALIIQLILALTNLLF